MLTDPLAPYRLILSHWTLLRDAVAMAVRARYAAVADEPVPARFDLDQLMRADTSWRRKAAIAANRAMIATTIMISAGVLPLWKS